MLRSCIFYNVCIMRRILAMIYESSQRILERSSDMPTIRCRHLPFYNQRTIPIDIFPANLFARSELSATIVRFRKTVLANVSEQL